MGSASPRPPLMALLFLERMSLGAVLITLLLGLALALKAGISETASGQLGTVQLVGMVAFGAAVKHCSLRFCARAERNRPRHE